MNEEPVVPTRPTTVHTERSERRADAATAQRSDPRTPHRSGWTAGAIAAIVVGTLLAVPALILLGGGATALWADRTQRDGGYLTSDVQEFTASGPALVTKAANLGTGAGWYYSPAVLETVRIRVAPTNRGPALFVGIGPTTDVERYLAGVKRTFVADFWTRTALTLDGDTSVSAPGQEHFWVASSVGPGTRSLEWEPTNGSWSVVVMNADGRPGINVRADLGARAPALPWIAVGVLAAGAVLMAGAALLIAGAARRVRSTRR
jgi:hypothetical protein